MSVASMASATDGDRPKLTVVIETYTVHEDGGALDAQRDLAATLRALDGQSVRGAMEIIVALDPARKETVHWVESGHANLRRVEVPGGTYYGMKGAGMAAARGDVIALLDGDCIPSQVWAESLLAAVKDGADVVAGKSRYQSRTLWGRTCSVFDFLHIQGDADGRANGFVYNNVAFRRELVPLLTVPPGLGRSGGCELEASALRAKGVPIMYAPAALVQHGDDYKRGGWFKKRLRNGFNSVDLLKREDAGTLKYRRLALLGPLAPLGVAAGRWVWDVGRIVTNRRELEIPIFAIPYFWVAALLMRGIEAVAGCLAYWRPAPFARRFG